MEKRRVRVVNMIPKSVSSETNQDSEPQLTVDPENHRTIIGTSFTPPPGGGSLAPLFVSVDGGDTWTLDLVIPGAGGVTGDTNDQSVRFGGASSLYAGILRGDNVKLDILRSAPYSPAAVMTPLVQDPTPVIDQPYLAVAQSKGKDRVFVGNNDRSSGPWRGSVEHSADARTAPAPAGFTQYGLDQRLPFFRELPPIRCAPHHDGTVYAGYLSVRKFEATDSLVDVVVARDDNFAAGATPFTALLDPGDLLPGMRVVKSTPTPWTFPFSFLGNQRVGSNVSIAVDPANSDVVYIAWSNGPVSGVTQSLRVRRSTDRGLTWSGDLVVVPNATNPALAVTAHGRVGFLYQERVRPSGGAPRWETHVQVTRDAWASPAEDIVAATTPDTPNPPGYTGPHIYDPYIGDYADLQAAGREFYGIFCALNTPDLANFPHGVRFQRNADFSTHQLFDLSGVTPVANSIDPFFVHISWHEEHELEDERGPRFERVRVKGLRYERLEIDELVIDIERK